MQRVGMMYPYFHTQTYAEGLAASGLSDSLVLARSAWAGVQKHRAVLWNGDTHSTFGFLQTAITAMQNVQMSGIAWWTTDIGGCKSIYRPQALPLGMATRVVTAHFDLLLADAGGDPKDATFRELIVRWFQFGVTCPIFRQHGARDTEPWLLGDVSFAAVLKVMNLRQTLRPYVVSELGETATSGLPFNRPLLFDYPEDAEVWKIHDQYMVGRELMAAPIYTMGARNRTVYFPRGTHWYHFFT